MLAWVTAESNERVIEESSASFLQSLDDITLSEIPEDVYSKLLY